MKTLRTLLIASVIATAGASSATAAIYPTLIDYNPAGVIADDRKNVANAYGAPDGAFLSLGLGGSAVFSFGTDFTGPAAVVEVTNGNRANYVETAEVWGGTAYDPDSNSLLGFIKLGDITNSSPTAFVVFTEIYKFLAIVDTSPGGEGRDGYDIDSVSVSAVPLPAALPLFASALGGMGLFGWLRKRRAAAAHA